MTHVEKVTFPSGGAELHGRLHRPPPGSDGPGPGVVLCHGFSGTMDRLAWHAERFAAAGLVALTFDYRGFGESGGEPRQVVDIAGQQDDIRAAVRLLRSARGVDPDRVALWGNSLGGAHVVTVAARDPRIAAVVAQLPYNGFPRQVEGRRARDTARLTAAILSDALRGRLGLAPRYVKMVGRPGEVAVTATDEAQRHIDVLTGGAATTSWRNQVAPRALLAMARYRPLRDAPLVRAPALLCAAEDDRETPIAHVRRLADAIPGSRLAVYPGTHFDVYGCDEIRARALDDQVAFLRGHLGARRGG